MTNALSTGKSFTGHEFKPRSNAGIDEAFDQGADGFFAMTYTIAQKAKQKAPDLALQGVYFWRGFFEMTLPGAKNFKDLKGKGLIVSGPVSNGSGGAPDMLFMAALTSTDDFSICHLPVMQGVKLISAIRDATLFMLKSKHAKIAQNSICGNTASHNPAR